MNSKIEIFVTVFVFLIACYYGFQSVHEIITRDNFKIFILSELKESERLITDMFNEKDSLGLASERENYLFLKKMLKRTNSLIDLGGGHQNLTITNLRYELDKYIYNDIGPKFEEPFYAKILKFIFLASNEMLVIVIVFLFGGIGAMISIMLNEWRLKLRRLFVGVSAALISFICVKGGVFIFIDTFYENSTMINPYAIVVLSLLSGMFTDRVFKFIEGKFKLKKNEESV